MVFIVVIYKHLYMYIINQLEARKVTAKWCPGCIQGAFPKVTATELTKLVNFLSNGKVTAKLRQT